MTGCMSGLMGLLTAGLILLTWAALSVIFLSGSPDREDFKGLTSSCLLGLVGTIAVAWAGVVLLSLGSLLYWKAMLFWWLAWGGSAVAVALLLLRRGKVWVHFPTFLPMDWQGVVNLAVLTVAGTAIACMGVGSPPNNTDSLIYHLPRQLLWMSHGTAFIHSAPNEVMLKWPPLSEYLGVNLWLLADTDRLHFLVQFTALCGILLIYRGIFRLWGLDQSAFSVAALFTVLTPAIFYQASNTKNDILLGFFLLLLVRASEEILRNRRITPLAGGICALSLGAVMMTKGTGLIYLMVLGPFLLVRMLRHRVPLPFRYVAAIPLLALLLASSHYLPHLGDITQGDLREHREHVNERINLRNTISVFARNAALQLAMPLEAWNHLEERCVSRLDRMLGVEENGPETTFNSIPFRVVYWPNSEDNVTGFSQVLLILLMPLAVFLPRWRKGAIADRSWLFLPLLQLLVFSAIFKWQPWHSRLIIPVEIMAGLPVGLLACRIPTLWKQLWIIGMILWIWPCLQGWHRPLFGPQAVFRMDDLSQRTVKVPSSALDTIAVSRILHGVMPKSILVNESFYVPLVYTGRVTRDWFRIDVPGNLAGNEDAILLQRKDSSFAVAGEGYQRVYDGAAVTLDLKESLAATLGRGCWPDFCGFRDARGLSEPFGPFPQYHEPLFCNATYPEFSFSITPDKIDRILTLGLTLPLFSRMSRNEARLYVDGVLKQQLSLEIPNHCYSILVTIPAGIRSQTIRVEFQEHDAYGVATSVTKLRLEPKDLFPREAK